MPSRTPSRSSAPPPEPTFFVDRDLGRRFPEALKAAGLKVEIHDDHYPGADKPADDVWLGMAARQGWIGVTHDGRMRYTSPCRDTVTEQNARLIVLKGHAKTLELAENFLRTLDAIRRFIAHHHGPWIAKLYRNSHDPLEPGRIEIWYQPATEEAGGRGGRSSPGQRPS